MILPTIIAVGIHAATWHERPNFHTSTPGVFVTLSNGVGVGAYANSRKTVQRKHSVWVGKTWASESLSLGPVEVRGEVVVGAVTGYSRPLAPLVTPGLALRHRGATLRLSYLPQAEPKGSQAVHFSVSFDVKE